MFDKVIEDIVSDDLANAKVLFQEGIPFYHVTSQTLFEVCSQYQVDCSVLEKKLFQPIQTVKPSQDSSIKEIIKYLTDSHRTFIKQSLPYYSTLIQNIRLSEFKNNQLARDLQFIFPLFVEDFIHHILEEEKTLFFYIQTLLQADKEKGRNISKAFLQIQNKSISSFALEHLHEDPMEGIRNLTNNYEISDKTSVHEKVIMYELAQFDKDLAVHAEIEDQLLFSKTLLLEQKIKEEAQQITSLN